MRLVVRRQGLQQPRRVRAEGNLGFSALSLPRAQQAIVATLAVAHDLPGLLPDGHLVRQVAACVGVPSPIGAPCRCQVGPVAPSRCRASPEGR